MQGVSAEIARSHLRQRDPQEMSDPVCIQFVTQHDMLMHFGPGLYASAPWGDKKFAFLVKHELSANPRSVAAKHTGIQEHKIKALYRNVNRENRTNRPHTMLEAASYREAASTHTPSSVEFRPGVFVEERADMLTDWRFVQDGGILLFFKFYDAARDDLYFIGHQIFEETDPISAVIPMVQKMLKSQSDDFELYEEVTSTMVEMVNQGQTLRQSGLETGDILIVQERKVGYERGANGRTGASTVFQHFEEHLEYSSLEENRAAPPVLSASNYPTVYARHQLAKLGLSVKGSAEDLFERMEQYKLNALLLASNTKIGENIRECHANSTCCDITLQVDKAGRIFSAHRVVLCRSPFFKALLTAENFKESGQTTISITEDADILSFVLDYLYGRRLADPPGEIDLVALHSASHRLMIAELQLSCEQKLAEGVTAENALTLLRHAELFSASALKRKCMSVAGFSFGKIATSDAYIELVKEDRQLHEELIRAVFSNDHKRQRL
jgi:hypothetical protein